MSRSGYCEDEFDWHTIMYRGAVASAIRGKRGQAFLKELLASLDALPVKALVRDSLEGTVKQSVSHWGIVDYPTVCAIGAVGRARGIDMSRIDPDDSDAVAAKFGIASALAREIVFENDEAFWRETPEERFKKMRAWVASQIIPE